jgi:two-component system, NarL family, sensor histidine kinase UhpB
LWRAGKPHTILHNRRAMLRPAALLVVLALWLACAGASFAQAQAAQSFADAVAADDQGNGRFPIDGVSRAVTLPDDWSKSRKHARTPLWYRLRFDAPLARERPALLGLLIERACANVEVLLNGQRLHGAGRMSDPISIDCERPVLVALPAALIEQRNNTLDLRLAGYALDEVASRQRAAGLSPPMVGPYDELHARQARTLLLKNTLPQLASASLLLLGVLVFVLGWWHKRERHLAWFGAVSIGWALVSARLWWPASGLPNFDSELLLVAAVPLVALAAVQFLLQYAGRRSRPIEVTLYAQCVIVPASLLLAGPQRVHMIASSWYLLLSLQALAAMVYYLRTTWAERKRDFWPMLGLLGVVALMVGIELAAQQRLLPDLWRVLPSAAMPLAFVGVGLRLIHQHGRALKHAEDLRTTLETRMRDASAAMERSYGQMAELRVEQVTQQERKRIAADLHDDLGAKLLTIVHTSESERISTLAREALEEMRLSVRGLTGKPVKLIDALGDWRAEVVGRLSQTGVEGEWQAPTEDVPQTLSARAYVQTTRILREAVNNIIKHSGASRCSIRCSLTGGDFQLKIQDNGKGIPLELDGRLDRGHGMSSMKHRAKQLEGQCLVESGPGYGTVIRLTIPLEKHTLPGAPAVQRVSEKPEVTP